MKTIEIANTAFADENSGVDESIRVLTWDECFEASGGFIPGVGPFIR